MRVLFTGGGSGGNVYPNLAIAAALTDAHPEAELLYAGTQEGMERQLAERAGLRFFALPARGLVSFAPGSVARWGATLVRGVRAARRLLEGLAPNVVVAVGGYVATPVVLAARGAGIPVLLFTPDVRSGWANRVLALLATARPVAHQRARVHWPFRDAAVTGYPVRREIGLWTRSAARAALGLPAEDRVLLVLGGSQGALAINRAVERALPALLPLAHLVHLTGERFLEEALQARAALPAELRERYHPYGYLHEEYALALAAADLVLSRAGASILGEYPMVGVPAVLVPYPHGRVAGHQRANAQVLAEAGAAIVVEEREIARALALARELLEDGERRGRMAAAVRRLARPEAARELAEMAWSLGEKRAEGRAPLEAKGKSAP